VEKGFTKKGRRDGGVLKKEVQLLPGGKIRLRSGEITIRGRFNTARRKK